MRVASEIILQLSIEQIADGIRWPHPWDHYPFITDGSCVWLRYQDLDSEQHRKIRRALAEIKRRLGTLCMSSRLD